MIQTETKTYTKEQRIHHFYCDNCNKYLGETREYDDGWYPDLGEFNLHFVVDGKWYEIEKCFCDDCRKAFLDKVENMLIELGFEKE
jgi:hypothetical protein